MIVQTEEKLDFYDYVVRAFAGCSGVGWIRTSCPRCEEMDGTQDYKQSLGYNVSSGGFNCFRCGMKGALPRNWRSKLEIAEPADYSPPIPEDTSVEIADGYVPLFEGHGLTASVFEAARGYILDPKPYGRGLDFDSAKSMQIGAALSGKLSGRVIVPIPNYQEPDKPWSGWVARDYTGTSPLPYRYPRGMSRNGLLFNECALWVETDDPVFVVEGVFDTTILYPNAVSCMGKPLESHVAKLAASRRPVVVCLDGDAWEEGWALMMTLRHVGVKAGNIRLPPKTDPDEVEKSWLMKEAMNSLMSEI